MGNGRWLGKSSGRRLAWVPVVGAMLLVLAASVLLGLGSRRDFPQAKASAAASSFATPFRSSLISKPDARAILGQLPLIFEPNQGQADERVKFQARGAGYSLFLDETGAVLGMQTGKGAPTGRSERFVRMKLVGANPAALAGADPLPGKSNYFVGNDKRKWHTGIPQFAGVRYASVYPGIDLVFYGNQGRLEYDFKVAPGADPSRAELEFNGASKLQLSGGDLILTGADEGDLRLRAPRVYQREGTRQELVAGRFVLRAANRVGFEIGPYDHSRELVIDPQLIFSTYFGGSGTETSPSVGVNGDGNIYLTGSTTSPPASFPLNGTAPTQLGTAPNIFVVKVRPSQPPAVVYATFLGGSGGPGADTTVGIGVDGGGSAYIVGNTSSSNFPTGGIPYQTGPLPKGAQCASITCTSVFVSVLSGNSATPGASLSYSSYLSGNGNDQASGMAIDTNGDVFVTGTTTSNNAPTVSPVPIDFPATELPVQLK